MIVKHYSPTDFHSEERLEALLRSFYVSNENFEFFLDDYRKSYDFCCANKHIKLHPIAFFKGEQLIAHIALIVDDRLPKNQAFFGFFEVIDDAVLFEEVWQELLKLARIHNIYLLKGPVNGSIWHQYRCIKEDSLVPHLKTEPITPLYYYGFLSRVNPTTEITYSSVMRDSYTEILKFLKSNRNDIEDKLNKENFTIEVTKKVTLSTILSIAKLSAKTFDNKSWGYTELDNTEFLKLYDPNKINQHIYKIFLLYHNKVLIGYCSTMLEGPAMICKTICIAQEYQGTGLGNALALKIHEEASQDGIEKIMYVLIRDGNQVHNFPTKDVQTFRRYAVFEYKLTT